MANTITVDVDTMTTTGEGTVDIPHALGAGMIIICDAIAQGALIEGWAYAQDLFEEAVDTMRDSFAHFDRGAA